MYIFYFNSDRTKISYIVYNSNMLSLLIIVIFKTKLFLQCFSNVYHAFKLYRKVHKQNENYFLNNKYYNSVGL